MIACLLLLIAVLGTMMYFTYAGRGLSGTSHRRVAAEIAQSRLEELRATSYDTLPSCAETGATVTIEGLTGSRTTTIEDVDDGGDAIADYRKVTVRVEWTQDGLPQQVELVSLRSRARLAEPDPVP